MKPLHHWTNEENHSGFLSSFYPLIHTKMPIIISDVYVSSFLVKQTTLRKQRSFINTVAHWINIADTQIKCFRIWSQNQTLGLTTHHLDGSWAEVHIRDWGVVCLQDVDAFPGQGLDDRLVALERGGLLSVQDEPTHPAVQLPRQQQMEDGGLDVFLLILVGIEGVPQVCRDVIWKEWQANTYYETDLYMMRHSG